MEEEKSTGKKSGPSLFSSAKKNSSDKVKSPEPQANKEKRMQEREQLTHRLTQRIIQSIIEKISHLDNDQKFQATSVFSLRNEIGRINNGQPDFYLSMELLARIDMLLSDIKFKTKQSMIKEEPIVEEFSKQCFLAIEKHLECRLQILHSNDVHSEQSSHLSPS